MDRIEGSVQAEDETTTLSLVALLERREFGQDCRDFIARNIYKGQEIR